MKVQVFTRKSDGAKVRAVQWKGSNVEDVSAFTKARATFTRPYFAEGEGSTTMSLHSIGGSDVKCNVGDFIVRDVRGFYPVAEREFNAGYSSGEATGTR